jgi:hypothetical protein
MNALPRYNFSTRIERVGKEDLTIGRELICPEIEGGSATLRFAGGASPFSPGLSLHNLLSSPPTYSADELYEAEAAVRRIAGYTTSESVETWASQLSEEITQFDD